jgi:putative ABC transport system ATP-binding protein
VSRASSAIVATRGLTRVYGSGPTRVEALRGVDLEVGPGEFVAVMGSSGSGKSTLLHLLAGLDRPTSGSVRVAGSSLDHLDDEALALLRRHRIGLIYQAFHLLDLLDVQENVALPLAIAGHAAGLARRRARRALAQVGLFRRRHHRPGELSGGEQQRVAIARALVIEPLVLLADEPTGSLDSVTGRQLLDLLCQLVGECRQTVLMVTHNPEHAARARRMILLRDGLVAGTGGSPHAVVDLHGAGGAALPGAYLAHAPWHRHRHCDGGGQPPYDPRGPQRLP